MVENCKKSMLVPVGWILLGVGLIAPNLVISLAQAGRSANGQLDTLARILYVGSDLLKLCFFAGIGCLIIGYLRNKKMPKVQDSQALVDDGTTWKCAQCAHENPNDTNKCKSCGFSLV